MFKLPEDQLPGSDRLSKAILKSAAVVDLVASHILDVPKGTYTTASSEWQDGCSGDTLYIPRLAIQRSLPPILIEVQLVVNETFMQRLLRYCQNVLQLYNSYPIVVVFCPGKLSPTTLLRKFTPIDTNPWMFSLICCDFWAKSCYIVSETTLSNHEMDVNASPFQALAAFLIEQSPTIFNHSCPEHPVIQMLYSLAKDCIRSDNEELHKATDIIDVICSNNEKMLHKLQSSLSNVPPDTSKAKRIVSHAIEFNKSTKRKYLELDDSDYSLESLPDCNVDNQRNNNDQQDDLQFIIQYRENRQGRMRWKQCLELAHKANRCQGITTVSGIRSFYYRASKTH